MTTYLQTIPPQVRRTAKQNQNGLRYIEKSNGDLLYNQKPKSWKERDWKIQQFRNDYIFTLSINENRYKEPLSQLICDTVPEVEIAEQLYFTRKTFEYIFVWHWEFHLNNLIVTANNRDAVVKNPISKRWIYQDWIIYLLKKIPNSMSFFKIVVKRENTTYYATTFFEKITSNPKAFDNEILKGKGYLIA